MTVEEVLASLTVEEVLASLTVEDILASLTPEERESLVKVFLSEQSDQTQARDES